MTIYFATGNQRKVQTAQNVLTKYKLDIEILKLDYEPPEIQSFDVQEVASFTAKYLADREQKPILVTDAGFYIKALNGFPGPYIKHFNKCLSSQDILNLMQGKTDRGFIEKECVAFCMPGREAITFLAKESSGVIVNSVHGKGSSIDKILHRDGMPDIQGNLSEEEIVNFFSKNLGHYNKFGEWYQKQGF